MFVRHKRVELFSRRAQGHPVHVWINGSQGRADSLGCGTNGSVHGGFDGYQERLRVILQNGSDLSRRATDRPQFTGTVRVGVDGDVERVVLVH